MKTLITGTALALSLLGAAGAANAAPSAGHPTQPYAFDRYDEAGVEHTGIDLNILGGAHARAETVAYVGPRGPALHREVRRAAPYWVRGARFDLDRRHFVFIADWRGFGLYRPYAGAHWVRVGPDFLLIGNRTGRIVDVVHRY